MGRITFGPGRVPRSAAKTATAADLTALLNDARAEEIRLGLQSGAVAAPVLAEWVRLLLADRAARCLISREVLQDDDPEA